MQNQEYTFREGFKDAYHEVMDSQRIIANREDLKYTLGIITGCVAGGLVGILTTSIELIKKSTNSKN